MKMHNMRICCAITSSTSYFIKHWKCQQNLAVMLWPKLVQNLFVCYYAGVENLSCIDDILEKKEMSLRLIVSWKYKLLNSPMSALKNSAFPVPAFLYNCRSSILYGSITGWIAEEWLWWISFEDCHHLHDCSLYVIRVWRQYWWWKAHKAPMCELQ